LVSFLEDLFWRLYFCMVKYLNFHNSSFFLLWAIEPHFIKHFLWN
jgi:hypothetical protein